MKGFTHPTHAISSKLEIKACCFYAKHKMHQLEAILDTLTLKKGR